MIVFLVSCIIDLIINAIQAIIAAIVLALVGIFKDALDSNRCVESKGQCICILEGDTSGINADTFNSAYKQHLDNCANFRLLSKL